MTFDATVFAASLARLQAATAENYCCVPGIAVLFQLRNDLGHANHGKGDLTNDAKLTVPARIICNIKQAVGGDPTVECEYDLEDAFGSAAKNAPGYSIAAVAPVDMTGEARDDDFFVAAWSLALTTSNMTTDMIAVPPETAQQYRNRWKAAFQIGNKIPIVDAEYEVFNAGGLGNASLRLNNIVFANVQPLSGIYFETNAALVATGTKKCFFAPIATTR